MLFGYRKVIVAVITLGSAVGLLIAGYPVDKLSWLGTPMAAFFAFNGLEHLPKVIETFRKINK